MKEILNFLIKIKKLEKLRRTGWILMGVKNPETVAEHTFRLAILAAFLAEKMRLNIERAIKIALFHDLCEVYSGDITTLLYHPKLQKVRDPAKRKQIEMKWARLSAKDKKKIGRIKFEKEKRALLKLIKPLKPNLKNEILFLWMEYEKGISKEAKLVRQLNSIETLIQSIEYFGSDEKKSGTTWWESTEEIVEDPLLLKFLEVIQKKFYGKKKPKTKENLEGILDFILEIGKLKKIQRKGWVLRGIKDPETVATHIFSTTLITWLLVKHRNLKFHKEKLLKMALYHEICEVYAGDRTPYDEILKNKNDKKKRNILKKWIRLSKKEKAELFLKDYQEEKAALEKMVSGLDSGQKKEIIQLWDEFKTGSSPEGYFLNQMEAMVTLFKALYYFNKKDNFSIGPFWEWALESSDSQINLEFMEELKKKFPGRKSLLKTVIKKL